MSASLSMVNSILSLGNMHDTVKEVILMGKDELEHLSQGTGESSLFQMFCVLLSWLEKHKHHSPKGRTDYTGLQWGPDFLCNIVYETPSLLVLPAPSLNPIFSFPKRTFFIQKYLSDLETNKWNMKFTTWSQITQEAIEEHWFKQR